MESRLQDNVFTELRMYLHVSIISGLNPHVDIERCPCVKAKNLDKLN